MRAYGITNAAPYASAPAVGASGDTYWNTTEKALYQSDGTAWLKTVPAALPPSGTAGGDLSGSYPNPQLGAGVIVDADVSATAAILGTKLADAPNGIPTAKLNDAVVTPAKLAASATLTTPIPSSAGTASPSTTELLVTELTITVKAGRPLAVLVLLNVTQQSFLNTAVDGGCTYWLRRGGTVGGINGAQAGPAQYFGVTMTALYQRSASGGAMFEVYVPASDGTVRYSVTAQNAVVSASIAVNAWAAIYALNFS